MEYFEFKSLSIHQPTDLDKKKKMSVTSIFVLASAVFNNQIYSMLSPNGLE